MMRMRQKRRRDEGIAVVILQIGRRLVRPRRPSGRKDNRDCSRRNRRRRSRV